MRRLAKERNVKVPRGTEGNASRSTVLCKNDAPMDADRDIKLAIGWNRFNLQLLGAWPDPVVADTGFPKYRFLIPTVLMIGFIFAPQTVNLVLIWGDVDLMTENLATATLPMINSIMKLLFIWYHRNALRPLLGAFVDDWHREKTEIERSIMVKNALIARKISIGCNILTQTMLAAFLSLRLIAISQLDRSNVEPDRCVPYTGYFPYDIRPSPVLELTCMAQVISAFCATVSYTAVDSFISMLVLHACGQYMTLGKMLKSLFNETLDTKNRKEFWQKLGAIVKRHEHLNRFSNTIEESFNMLLLCQMLTCTVQLCFQGFQVFRLLLQESDSSPTFELMFIALSFSFIGIHLYIYCYVGEKLLLQSSSLSHVAYSSQWFNAPPQQARSLLLVMLRSTRPLCLTAGKYSTLCLETYSNILKTSMGYLSVLVAVSAN